MRRLLATITAVALSVAPLGAAASPGSTPARSPAATGQRAPARLGLAVIDLTPELRQHFAAAPDRGVLIGRVLAGSPAAAAGLRVGDVLIEVDGRPVATPRDVSTALTARAAGDRVEVIAVRAGARTTFTVTLDEGLTGPFGLFRLFGTTPLREWAERARSNTGRSCET